MFQKLQNKPQSGRFSRLAHSSPLDCTLLLFHVCFLHSERLDLVSLLTHTLVLTKTAFTQPILGLDAHQSVFLVHGAEQPLLQAHVAREHQHVWKLLREKHLLHDAYRFCPSAEER